MNALYVIPARGGSRGIPQKNIRSLAGKPLICHTIDVARKLVGDEHICVSSDDAEIIDVVKDYGLTVPFVRPAELATDEAGMQEVLLHAVKHYEQSGRQYDCLVLLQPTSPLRSSVHVEEALAMFSSDIDMVLGVVESKANPYFSLYEENKRGFLEKSKSLGPITGRQNAPKVYQSNGAVYVINVEALKRGHMQEFTAVKKYVMDELSSIDLDTPRDWQFCSLLIENGEAKPGA